MSEKDKIVIGTNLKYLRKMKGLTQQELADKLDIRRSSIGAYEECRATPRYNTLEQISDYFKVSIDLLVKEDLTLFDEEDLRLYNEQNGVDIEGRKLRVLPISVDANGKENIDFVQQKASAGYLNGYADPEYIGDLPKFQLPMLGTEGTFRAFEIKGDSMMPLPNGSAIVAEYVENWRNIKDGETYVILSESEGVVYKRVYKEEDQKGHIRLRLVSDNPEYVPYYIEIEDVLEVWRAKMFLSKELPQPQQEMTLERLTSIVLDLQQTVMKLRN